MEQICRKNKRNFYGGDINEQDGVYGGVGNTSW